MSNLFSGINARIRGVATKPGSASSQKNTASASSPQANSPTFSKGSQPCVGGAPRTAVLASQPSLGMGMGEKLSGEDALGLYHLPRPLPIWLNPAYTKHIVKGNFMTLSARPKTVDQGEWIAHQVVDHYRLLWNFVRVIHEKEDDGTTICNASTCPRMSAGTNHSFTWLNQKREPVELPAYEYMTLMQRWISGKIDDTNIFPTDANGVSFAHNTSVTSTPLSPLGNSAERDWVGKRSGFPENFVEVCQTIFRQMFRVYAHLYWAHYVDPFYHLNLEKQLNSCFSHFVLTACALDMLKAQELEPMQPLVDLWAANGTFPPGSKAHDYANSRVGDMLTQLANAS